MKESQDFYRGQQELIYFLLPSLRGIKQGLEMDPGCSMHHLQRLTGLIYSAESLLTLVSEGAEPPRVDKWGLPLI